MASTVGRSLFGASAALVLPVDPVERLWQLTTTLCEHRGDSHVQVLSMAGIDGCEAHRLHAAEFATPADVLRENRGWTHEEWDAAGARLSGRGLLAGTSLTAAGQEKRNEVEAETDRLANEPWLIGSDELGRALLLGALSPLMGTIAASGTIPYPNPMGLPAGVAVPGE